MTVQQYMSRPVIQVAPDASLSEVEQKLRVNRISSLAVTSDGRLVGTITRTDLLRVGRRGAGADHRAALLTLPEQRADQVMTREVVTVDPETSLHDAAQLLIERRIHRLFVVRDADLLGVFSTRDAMAVIRDRRVKRLISDVMSKPVFTVSAEEPLSLATDRLSKAGVSGLVVVEGTWPIGVFTQVEALESKDMHRTTPVEEAMCSSLLCLHDLPLHRAAAQAVETRVRRVLVIEDRQVQGILTGIDFARALTK